MNKSFWLSTGRRFWFNIGSVFSICFLALLAFATPATLAADQLRSVITLIPTEVLPSKAETAGIAGGQFGNEKILLRFRASSLPAHANLTAARLSLVSSGHATAQQTVNVVADTTLTQKPDTGTPFGKSRTLKFAKDERVYWDAGQDFLGTIQAQGGERKFSLLLTTPSSASSTWYLTGAADLSHWPRLILEYAVADQPALTQSDGLPAVQSARPFLPTARFGGKDSGAFSYVTRPFSNAWSETPVFHNGLVYLMTDDIGKKALHALNPLGGKPVWTIGVDGNPGQHLLVSPSGRLYIVGNGRIIAYQLGSGNPAQAPVVVQDLKLTNLDPANAPSLGPDGSLYLVKGQEVYGFNPDLQELWKVTLADKTTSRVTVGPSGRFVYLTAKNEGLVAINAQTGEYFTNPLPNQDHLKVAGKPSLHAPVVILHPDGSEKIYVAANSVNDGVLACFNNPFDDHSGKIAAAENWPPLKGLWSQPIPDQLSPGTMQKPASGKQIYAVRVADELGTLTGIDWLTGATKAMAPTFTVGDSPDLLNGGNLALDQAGTRFVWNGAGDVDLFAFGSAFSGRLHSSTAVIPMRAQLLFGGDGTLYANPVKGDRVLRVIVPKYTLSAGSDANIYSPTHLWVDGLADQTTVLKAAGNVLLGPGFTVRQGATLTIATGAPSP
ncbi:PQQ-binding-like beta-propeller repeat protein [Candidatus Accumulibacter sp. ACC007]|uniref:outer membrane protein assembly factor BamB family protein n=1 Tax=Candidatus Accumulibacter sp. ACC007 TaxID=2823333 RepID=UPI0025BD3911|nr:PQQ-binding-like beta-propeller repeat protein [Candidatus Accumulibacter sp. ACC007]